MHIVYIFTYKCLKRSSTTSTSESFNCMQIQWQLKRAQHLNLTVYLQFSSPTSGFIEYYSPLRQHSTTMCPHLILLLPPTPPPAPSFLISHCQTCPAECLLISLAVIGEAWCQWNAAALNLKHKCLFDFLMFWLHLSLAASEPSRLIRSRTGWWRWALRCELMLHYWVKGQHSFRV